MTSKKASFPFPKLIPRPPLTPTSFQTLDTERFDKVKLYTCLPQTPEGRHDWRYSLTIIDRIPSDHASSPNCLPCAVFLIPAGRESEYIFSSREGLLNVAESANCVRLITVAFHRNEVYVNQDFVQQELGNLVQTIAQRGVFFFRYKNLGGSSSRGRIEEEEYGMNFQIPFLATKGIGKRNVIAEGKTDSTGSFCVEEVLDDDENVLRRLYFLNNPNVIQSEVCMRDDEVDVCHLAFEYHKHLCAGTIVFTQDPSAEDGPKKALVIGLGGGSLPSFLHKLIPNMHVVTVELDENILHIAKSHFGFEEDDGMSVVIGDGLSLRPLTPDYDAPAYITFPQESLSLIAIDVDSKDNTTGMSCPPVSFVQIPYLTHLKNILAEENSVLAINVSARDSKMLEMVKRNVSRVFPTVFVSGGGEDHLNVVVFATKTDLKLPQEKNVLAEKIATLCERNFMDHHPVIQSQLEECAVTIESVHITEELVKDNKTAGKAKKSANKKKKGGKKKKGK